jgi:hypothetical protein
MNVEVTEDASGTSVLSTTANVLTLASGQQDTVAANATFTPANPGLYNIDIWSVADSAALGNTITYTDTTTKMTMVTDYIYGKDYGSADGYWRLNRPIGGFEVSSNYDIFAAADLYSVDVHISDWSIVGSVVFATLYEEDISGGDPIPLDVTDDYTITSADLGAWVNIPFLSSQSLLAGTGYRISVGANQHPTDTVGIDMSGSGDYSSQGIWDPEDVFEGTAGAQWWTISDIPMLRMNFNPSTISAVTDVKQTIFNVYPNPSTGEFVITLDATAKYDVTITNVLGQKVYATSTNTMETTIDLSNFDKGVYTVELKNNDATFTEKVIVE